MGDQEFLPLPKGFATKVIHDAQEPEQWDSMAVVTPLVTTTTFKQTGPAEFKKFEYARTSNPTRDVLERCLASLENGKYGLAFSSGMGAITSCLGMFKNGDHVICSRDVYGGTHELFTNIVTNFGIEVSFVDGTSANNFQKAVQPNTKVIWIETPSNPTLQVIDIKAVSEIAKRNNIVFVVDNTFLSPYLQRPLEFGADIVMHSLTKYINGHTDVTMGALITSDEKLYQKLKHLQNAMGIVPSPFDCYQALRGLKTLPLRMQQHMKNSLLVAKFLEKHPKVERVNHPGLPSHPQHALFKRQTSGHSGMLALYIKGDFAASKKFLQSLKLICIADSLGGYDSLAALPVIMTHPQVPKDEQKLLQISDNLIRLSIGLEDPEDLIDDLNQALNSI